MNLPVDISDSDLEWLSSASSEDSYTGLSRLNPGLTPVISCDTPECVCSCWWRSSASHALLYLVCVAVTTNLIHDTVRTKLGKVYTPWVQDLPVHTSSLQSDVGTFPVAIWEMIIQHLRPTTEMVHIQAALAQRDLWRVQLVCKSFYSILKAPSQLDSYVYLHEHISEAALPSLTAWLRARAATIQTLQAPYFSCTSTDYLSTLSASASLTSVSVKLRTSADVAILGSFRNLSNCTLRSSEGQFHQRLDLTPLGGLLHLSNLSLGEGSYDRLSVASHLISLDLFTADVRSTADCTFFPHLVFLRVADGGFDRLHHPGMLACTALQRLEVSGTCLIPAGFEFGIGGHRGNRIQRNMSALSCLTKLVIHECDLGREMCLVGICTLPSLQRLQLGVPGCTRFGNAFSNLNKLTFLKIKSKGSAHVDQPVIFCCSWRSFQSLQIFHLDAPFTADASFLELGLLPCLREFTVQATLAVDAGTAEYLQQVLQLQELGRRYPELMQ